MEIIKLTEEDIVEYSKNYDESLLRPGMMVFCDDELYLTADEVEFEVARLTETLGLYDWTDENEKKERLATLQEALEILKN